MHAKLDTRQECLLTRAQLFDLTNERKLGPTKKQKEEKERQVLLFEFVALHLLSVCRESML